MMMNYGNGKWRAFRDRYLKANPVCVRCGKVADVLDHIIKHNNDRALIYDKANIQSLCKLCHDSYKQRLEKSGTVSGCDARGLPIDPNHWWNKR